MGQRACVTLVWDYSNTGRMTGPHCDDFGESFPYALVYPGTDAPCDQWDYAGNVTVERASGCIDFADFGGASVNLIDVTVEVSGAVFTGTIRASNR
jgi:hypothetical protein